jgi:hypothetical protein
LMLSRHVARLFSRYLLPTAHSPASLLLPCLSFGSSCLSLILVLLLLLHAQTCGCVVCCRPLRVSECSWQTPSLPGLALQGTACVWYLALPAYHWSIHPVSPESESHPRRASRVTLHHATNISMCACRLDSVLLNPS